MVEESRARPPNSTKVFVGNLSATCSADDLHGLFSTFGRVLDCDKVKGKGPSLHKNKLFKVSFCGKLHLDSRIILFYFEVSHMLTLMSSFSHSTARLCSNVGYAFVHMERKEEALAAIEALNGTMFKGRQLAVELSKAQPLINQLVTSGNSANPTGCLPASENKKSIPANSDIQQLLISSFLFSSPLHSGAREGLLPRPPPSLEHHQSQAAVLAAAAAAAAGLPIQVSSCFSRMSAVTKKPFTPGFWSLS